MGKQARHCTPHHKDNHGNGGETIQRVRAKNKQTLAQEPMQSLLLKFMMWQEWWFARESLETEYKNVSGNWTSLRQSLQENNYHLKCVYYFLCFETHWGESTLILQWSGKLKLKTKRRVFPLLTFPSYNCFLPDVFKKRPGCGECISLVREPTHVCFTPYSR